VIMTPRIKENIVETSRARVRAASTVEQQPSDDKELSGCAIFELRCST
jgi:hypothetical protein